jgi:hypothetical protein
VKPKEGERLEWYNIVSEGGDWLEGAHGRAEIRRLYAARLQKNMAPA